MASIKLRGKVRTRQNNRDVQILSTYSDTLSRKHIFFPKYKIFPLNKTDVLPNKPEILRHFETAQSNALAVYLFSFPFKKPKLFRIYCIRILLYTTGFILLSVPIIRFFFKIKSAIQTAKNGSYKRYLTQLRYRCFIAEEAIFSVSWY